MWYCEELGTAELEAAKGKGYIRDIVMINGA